MTELSVTKGNYMEILTYGKGERLLACSSTVARGAPAGCKIIILPIPTTRDGKTVQGTDVELSEVVSRVERGTLVCGYSIPEETARQIALRGGLIYDGSLDEELILENARLTALGTVGWLLTDLGRAPKDCAVGIIGYGRIGRELLRLLLFLGYRVRVYSSSGKRARELSEMGIEVRDSAALGDPSGLDVLINTAPSRQLTERDIPRLLGIQVVDLASGGYLDGIPGLIKLPSVPEKCFAASAGRVYGERILAHLGAPFGKGGE